jgi:GNAT superfamily N-acetyltransferase
MTLLNNFSRKMEIHIKPLLIEHAKDVQVLSKQLGYEISLDDTIANISEVLSLKNHTAFVAIENNGVVGWIHAFKTTTIESLPFIELAGLVVDEKQRGKGIGKILVEKIKAWCKEQDVSSLRVRSNVKRKEAHQFYLNNGFKEIKEQKVFQMSL